MKFKKKIILTTAIMGFGVLSLQAQTGIGTTNPDNSAQLDITSDKRGLLMPRIALVKTTDKTPIVGTPAKSLMVFNTATNEDVTPGFYFWDSAKWVRVSDASTTPQEPWYDVATNTGATSNIQDIYQTGSVAIGKNTLQKGVALDVNGSIRVGETSGEPVIGENSMAIGLENLVSGSYAGAIGSRNNLSGNNSLAVGSNNTTGHNGTFLVGTDLNLQAGGNSSGSTLFGEGNAIGAGQSMKNNAIFGTMGAINQYSLSTAKMNNNVIFGQANMINPYDNTNIIENVAVFGYNNLANFESKGAIKSVAIFGSDNEASYNNQFVIGSYNINVPDALFEIGNGIMPAEGSDLRYANASNAITVLKNGNTGIGAFAPSNKLHVKGTNPLRLEGLQAGATTDKFLTADANGVVRISDGAVIPAEPWRDSVTNTGATTNTQNIYQMGNVSIGAPPVDGVALGVTGVMRIGSDLPGYDFGIEGNSSMGIGYNVALSGNNSVAIGRNVIVNGDNAVAIGNNAHTEESETFAAGTQVNILKTNGGGAVGSAVFGYINAIDTEVGLSSNMQANTMFGSHNKIYANSSSSAILNQNAVFGTLNAIQSDGNTNMIENVVIFGKSNHTVFAGKGAITGTTIFGFNNTASNSNQFVIGSQNENPANALFEIGMGTAINQRLNAVTVLNNGSVGIGTSAPGAAYKLYVNGQAGGTMAWSQSSDRRYKKDITPITGALDKIMKIQGVGYNWKTEEFKDKNFDSKHQLGVIAQDIEKILPDAVSKDENGYYSVSYTTLVPVLVEAVKEQEVIIEKQDKKISDLEARLLKLEKLMDK